MTRLTGVSALALCAMAGPALADLTPQQAWDDLSGYLLAYGYEVTADETTNGGTLSVANISMSVDIPEEDMTIDLVMQGMDFIDRGDGTVSVSLASPMPMTVEVSAEGEDDPVIVSMEYVHSGLDMVMSGAIDDVTYTYSGESLGVVLKGITAEGESLPSNLFRASLMTGPVDGTAYRGKKDGMVMLSETVNYGDFVLDMAGNSPDSNEGGSLNAKWSGLSTDFQTVLPEGVSFDDAPALINGGGSFSGTWSHAGGNIAFSVMDRGETTAGTLTSTGSEGVVGIAQDGMVFDFLTKGLVLALSGGEIPFPVNAEMAEMGMKLLLPLQPGDAPQEAQAGITLAGLSVSDMLWNIVDPSAALPRDPATARIDLTAMVTPFISLTDEESMEEIMMTGGVPGELNTVTLNTLELDAAGGKITGEGAFTFDNSDLESFDGMPRPEGELNLNIAGANGLIDKLIAMGLLAEQDAMGARMMLGMFTVPGSAPDTASSKIEINAQGHVLANGQRIK